MEPRQLTVLAGCTFLVSDLRGDVDASPDQPEGLFHRDMRHLSRWQLRLNGRPLDPVASEVLSHDRAVVFLREPTGGVRANPALSIVRHRQVGDAGIQERVEVTNHDTVPVSLVLTVLFDADFADVFEVKDRLGKHGRLLRHVGSDHVVLTYERAVFRRETRIEAGEGLYSDGSVDFRLSLQPGEAWARTFVVAVATAERAHRRRAAGPEPLDEWLDRAPRLESDSEDLCRLYRQSLVDLAALRFPPDGFGESCVPAAGLPWFMALFGRDSLITSYQALPYVPDLARSTLRALAAGQAREIDHFRDAEPGKILHELRHGELTYFEQRPHSPYYGSADATPLFLVVLDEYERWTGDDQTVRDLEGAARAALRWLETYADHDGDGFVEYATRNTESGLVNQGWKDSWNAITHPDGRLANGPLATCEIQGYAYDARRRTARLAREVWGDQDLADRLDADADALKRRFDEAFWLPHEHFYALALDGDNEPVPTMTSNMGHLLWSGIVPEERLDAVVERLMGTTMFSGWGVRTLAEGQPAYNPMEYHNGTVWPHDNAIIAAGLCRYGRREEAARIAEGILATAPYVGYRLPEAFVGSPRSATGIPEPYPSACSPQAWAAGSPLLLISTLLGLRVEPDGPRIDPHLPDSLERLALYGVPTPSGHVDTDRLPAPP